MPPAHGQLPGTLTQPTLGECDGRCPKAHNVTLRCMLRRGGHFGPASFYVEAPGMLRRLLLLRMYKAEVKTFFGWQSEKVRRSHWQMTSPLRCSKRMSHKRFSQPRIISVYAAARPTCEQQALRLADVKDQQKAQAGLCCLASGELCPSCMCRHGRTATVQTKGAAQRHISVTLR